MTDADRKAAFQDLKGHAVHDRALNYFVLFDQLEWQSGSGANGPSIDMRGWVGRDRDRLWFRAEGDGADGRVDEAQTHVLYGRQISRWWDVVGGIRQDFRPGPAQTWAAFGIQGLAPYSFDLEATAYIGASGRSHVRFEAEYELLLTNRLIAQPLFETEIYGKADPEHGFGAGLVHDGPRRASPLRVEARIRAVHRHHLEEQVGRDRRPRESRRREHARRSCRHRTAALVLMAACPRE